MEGKNEKAANQEPEAIGVKRMLSYNTRGSEKARLDFPEQVSYIWEGWGEGGG